MAARVATGYVGGSITFFMKKQSCFPSHHPGKGETDPWLAWLVRSIVATAPCPLCAPWLPLLSAAAYGDAQRGCGLQRSKQALEQNRKYVLVQTSLIMESKWRERLNINKLSCWKRVNILHHCKGGGGRERWNLSEFISLPHKTKFRLFHICCKT